MLDKQVKEGDLVQIYVKHSNAKRGKWSLPKPVLKFDPESQTVTVAGAKEKYQKAAVEDTSFAVPQEMDVAVAIQEVIDECSNRIDEALDEISGQMDYSSDDDGQEIPILEASEEESGSGTEPRSATPPTPSIQPPDTELSSNELDMLRDYRERFKHKEFLLWHARDLSPSVTNNAYATEESNIPPTANVATVQQSFPLYPFSANPSVTCFYSSSISLAPILFLQHVLKHKYLCLPLLSYGPSVAFE